VQSICASLVDNIVIADIVMSTKISVMHGENNDQHNRMSLCCINAVDVVVLL